MENVNNNNFQDSRNQPVQPQQQQQQQPTVSILTPNSNQAQLTKSLAPNTTVNIAEPTVYSAHSSKAATIPPLINDFTAKQQLGTSTSRGRPHFHPSSFSSSAATAMDSLSSGWEESENESSNLSGDVALLEAKYKCLNTRLSSNTIGPNQAPPPPLPPTNTALNSTSLRSSEITTEAVESSKSNSSKLESVTILAVSNNNASENITSSGENSPTTVTRKPIIGVAATSAVSAAMLTQTASSKSCSKTVDDDDSGSDAEQSSSGSSSEGGVSAALKINSGSNKVKTNSNNSDTLKAAAVAATAPVFKDQAQSLSAATFTSMPPKSQSEILTNSNESNPVHAEAQVSSASAAAAPLPARFFNLNNSNSIKFNYNNLINQLSTMGSISSNASVTVSSANSTSNTRRQMFHHQAASEALGHFMFEFSKQVLAKAGGSLAAVYLGGGGQQPTATAPPAGPHRNLHICSFLTWLYALGLHNATQPNWVSRTYSSHVSLLLIFLKVICLIYIKHL